MPRKVALLAALAASLAFAAPAGAAVVQNRNATQVAQAMSDPLGSAFTSAAFPTPALPPAGNPAGVGDAALTGFPTSGTTFAALSSGNVEYLTGGASQEDNGGGPAGHGSEGDIDDVVTLQVTLNVPADRNCLRFDLRFFSNELSQSATFNDAFVAELDANDFQVARDETTGDLVFTDPNNFAIDPAGNRITVRTTAFDPANAAGTPFEGATPTLIVSKPITGGTHVLYLSIFDIGDDAFDSAALLDALRLEAVAPGACVAGAAQRDTAAPALSIASPANGSTITGAPTFSGSAGDAAGDLPEVTVRTTSSTGQSVDVRTNRTGAGWSVGGPALAPGTYTATAFQNDAAGNAGASAPVTFTVAPAQTGPPPPVTGKAVNVAVVKGKVRIRRPGGKFVALDDASQIPTGSTIDTRNGTVALTSTAAGGTTQKANFFDGLFKVTQTRGKKPLTNLTLNEKLAKCPKGKKKAKASAKKRKRRLWGDGKGNFRTSGRRSAATVAGTKWLVEDSCKGTLTRVVRGVVKVRDYKKKKTVRVKAGKRYMAR